MIRLLLAVRRRRVYLERFKKLSMEGHVIIHADSLMEKSRGVRIKGSAKLLKKKVLIAGIAYVFT